MHRSKNFPVKAFALSLGLVVALALGALGIGTLLPSTAQAQSYVLSSGNAVASNGATISFQSPRVLYGTLGSTSPASASTVVGPTITGLDLYAACVVQTGLRGATGGVLDVVLQSSASGGAAGGWFDMGHYTQIAAAAALAGSVGTFAKGFAQAPTAINTVDGTPVLAAGTHLTSALGGAIRVVYVAGASTSAGAAETINLYCYNPVN